MEHLDVLIVGAGLSGIGAACHLQADSPGKSFAILESRDAIGGTWDLFRYPGIRSDSDMFTLGYSFRPWEEAKAIADGPSILKYIEDTARDHGVRDKVRLHHKVASASWSSADARWTVDVERTDTGETLQLSCSFLLSTTGYYRYDEGFTPEFPGRERFQGTVVHPQHWPEDLDYRGKKVVVIGSGATAVTLVPSMAPETEHITMLQRSPTYIIALPAKDPVADVLRKRLPAKVAYAIVRWKNVTMTTGSFILSRKFPRAMRRFFTEGVKRQLPAGTTIEPHFSPKYDPWDQRVCLVPDGDLFKALRAGTASIVTDRIATFTETGIELESGDVLEADIVITATGLNLELLGGIEFTVDDRKVDLSETVGYKGMMFSGVPNLAAAIGYTNASWTLKCDLTCEYVCRLLNHMDAHGYAKVTPTPPPPGEPTLPFIDLASGYVQRSVDKFPKQGSRAPWRLYQNYARDIWLLRRGELDDGVLKFESAGVEAPAAQETVAA
jgi:cation diffusion facilitator CzcD-associated flavoprotein CzcO